jgi:hypothetical protein
VLVMFQLFQDSFTVFMAKTHDVDQFNQIKLVLHFKSRITIFDGAFIAFTLHMALAFNRHRDF